MHRKLEELQQSLQSAYEVQPARNFGQLAGAEDIQWRHGREQRGHLCAIIMADTAVLLAAQSVFRACATVDLKGYPC